MYSHSILHRDGLYSRSQLTDDYTMHFLALLTFATAASCAVAGGPDLDARDARLPLIANRRTKPAAASTQDAIQDTGSAEEAQLTARDARNRQTHINPALTARDARNRQTHVAAATASIINKLARDAVEALSASAPFKADEHPEQWNDYLEALEEEHNAAGTATESSSWPKVTKHVVRAVSSAYDHLNAFADGIKQKAVEAELRARAHASGVHVSDYKRDLETGDLDLDDETEFELDDHDDLHARDTDELDFDEDDLYARDTDDLEFDQDGYDVLYARDIDELNIDEDDYDDLYARDTDELDFEEDDYDYDDVEEQHIARRDPGFYVNHGAGAPHRARSLDVDDSDTSKDDHAEKENDHALERRVEPSETQPPEPVPQPTVSTTAEATIAPKTTPGHHGHGHWHAHGHHGHVAHPAATATASASTKAASV